MSNFEYEWENDWLEMEEASFEEGTVTKERRKRPTQRVLRLFKDAFDSIDGFCGSLFSSGCMQEADAIVALSRRAPPYDEGWDHLHSKLDPADTSTFMPHGNLNEISWYGGDALCNNSCLASNETIPSYSYNNYPSDEEQDDRWRLALASSRDIYEDTLVNQKPSTNSPLSSPQAWKQSRKHREVARKAFHHRSVAI